MLLGQIRVKICHESNSFVTVVTQGFLCEEELERDAAKKIKARG
jgi:hypothetical protein